MQSTLLVQLKHTSLRGNAPSQGLRGRIEQPGHGRPDDQPPPPGIDRDVIEQRVGVVRQFVERVEAPPALGIEHVQAPPERRTDQAPRRPAERSR